MGSEGDVLLAFAAGTGFGIMLYAVLQHRRETDFWPTFVATLLLALSCMIAATGNAYIADAGNRNAAVVHEASGKIGRMEYVTQLPEVVP